MSTAAPADPELLDLEISADDYARAAATDQEISLTAEEKKSAKEARTFQTEDDFQKEKDGYDAKIDGGDIWKQLTHFDPPFQSSHSAFATTENPPPSEDQENKLDRKQFQLVTAAVGELYWKADYERILDICRWAGTRFELEPKMGESVRRWQEKSNARIERGRGKKEG
ncbi:hypothetical protein AAFC00_002590 [Neodothiora populina]|uniref:Uncharacterized protein n=1 Tax=Neodothiora populina TaxID=2781224 RepID=A0ABR3P7K0_9PEZI